MSDMAKAGRFKSYFLRGLAVLLPTVLTIWIFLWGYNFINDKISVYIKRGIVFLIKLAGGSEEELAKFWVRQRFVGGGFCDCSGDCVCGGGGSGERAGQDALAAGREIHNEHAVVEAGISFHQADDGFFPYAGRYQRRCFRGWWRWSIRERAYGRVGLVTGTGLKKIVRKVEERSF